MVSHLYRFRSTKQLLDGFNELDAQQIYFAPPEDLNDPIETFKDLVWTGDEIVWRNLLRHYILIFIEATSRVFSGVDCDRNQVRSFVSMVPDNLPPAPVREIYDRSSNAFLNEMAVRKLVELMAGAHKSHSAIRAHELSPQPASVCNGRGIQGIRRTRHYGAAEFLDRREPGVDARERDQD